jgi:hypothetical protein
LRAAEATEKVRFGLREGVTAMPFSDVEQDYDEELAPTRMLGTLLIVAAVVALIAAAWWLP